MPSEKKLPADPIYFVADPISNSPYFVKKQPPNPYPISGRLFSFFKYAILHELRFNKMSVISGFYYLTYKGLTPSPK